MFFKAGVLKSRCYNLFVIKLQVQWPATLLKGIPTQMFSCQYCKFLRTPSFYRKPLVAASVRTLSIIYDTAVCSQQPKPFFLQRSSIIKTWYRPKYTSVLRVTFTIFLSKMYYIITFQKTILGSYRTMYSWLLLVQNSFFQNYGNCVNIDGMKYLVEFDANISVNIKYK